ncbi:hypothetical protein DESC_100007 [Desulfosarcina cetonica]|nr:hypothetical protein DESC_100007 [Desulfosarcina cetonica]
MGAGLDSDEPYPFFHAEASKNGHVHYFGVDRACGRIQHRQCAHHDGDGKNQGYRHIEDDGGDQAAYHAHLCIERVGDRLFGNDYRWRPGLFTLCGFEAIPFHKTARGCLFFNYLTGQSQSDGCCHDRNLHGGDLFAGDAVSGSQCFGVGSGGGDSLRLTDS